MRRSRLLPLIIATALFMENTDSTVISTSLPVIAQDLGDGPDRPQAGADLLSGEPRDLHPDLRLDGGQVRRPDDLHARPSACSWRARSPARPPIPSNGFVIARFVQGMGGAMMVPVGRLVLLRSVPRSEVVQALATLTIPALVGPMVGPPLGGFITTYFDWRWIFFINIPIGILGIVLATHLRPEHQGRRYAAPRHHRLPALRLRLRPAHARLRLGRAASDPGRDLRRLRDRRRDLPRALCPPRAAHPATRSCSSAC